MVYEVLLIGVVILTIGAAAMAFNGKDKQKKK